MPNNDIAKKLVEYAGVPIATPSANISGFLSSINLEDIVDDFSNKVDFFIDGGNSNIGLESTIVKVIDGVPHILRPGYITPEQIKSIVGSVIVENKNNTKHYQLSKKCVVIYDDDPKKMSEQIINIANDYNSPVVVCYEEHMEFYIDKIYNNSLYPTSYNNLFSTLKKADNSSADIIIIEGVKSEGIGIAIMNRLLSI